MSKKNWDTIVLSYYDCILRKSDVHLLLGSNWINDGLIGFYFEYLGKKLESSNTNSEILYASPELTQLLKLSDSSEISIFLDPLNAPEKKYIFFPLNDNTKVSAGGTHWSLLVFSKVERTFFHFDSFELINEYVARDFAANLDKYLLRKELGKFEQIKCPQQENCIDCGLFLMCFTDVLTEHIFKNSKVEGCNLENVKEMVSRKRESLLELIETLKASKCSE